MTTTDAMKAKLADLCEAVAREWIATHNATLKPWQKEHVWRTGQDRIEISIARPDLGATKFDVLEIQITEKRRDGGEGVR
jgi:hypothetical protein